MDQPPKLCPLSFGFNIKQQQPCLLDSKMVDIKIQIGFPCIKEKCLAYQEDTKFCDIISKEIP